MKFIAYYRVSTDKQGQSGLGLEAQKQICFSYAQQQGAEIITELTDIESGSQNDRVNLIVALDMLKNDRSCKLLVAKQCRLTRSVALMSKLLEELPPNSIVVAESPQASIFELHIRAVLNEETRRQISINTKNALQAAKARGVKLGAPPKDIKRISQSGGDATRRKAAEFAIGMIDVIQIIKARNDRFDPEKYAEDLNALGILTYQRKKWNRGSVYRLMCNIHKLREDINLW
jgi:DNA invertase Pin-like site-specific DNA recombinase